MMLPDWYQKWAGLISNYKVPSIPDTGEMISFSWMRQLAVGAELGRMPLDGDEAKCSLRSRGKMLPAGHYSMKQASRDGWTVSPHWRDTLPVRFLVPAWIQGHSSESHLLEAWEGQFFLGNYMSLVTRNSPFLKLIRMNMSVNMHTKVPK